ncbi:hypothetical protein [Streptodolium elevatio]|uniref:Uncharacterized protein n=1 Tax=Streptodolium elevatio TaxID=3157996 RepID=A0ABV3DGU3_9ACTN
MNLPSALPTGAGVGAAVSALSGMPCWATASLVVIGLAKAAQPFYEGWLRSLEEQRQCLLAQREAARQHYERARLVRMLDAAATDPQTRAQHVIEMTKALNPPPPADPPAPPPTGPP